MTKHEPLPNGKSFWETLGAKPVDYRDIKYNYEMLARDIRSSVIKHSQWQKNTISKKPNKLVDDLTHEQMTLDESQTKEPEVSVSSPASTVQQMSLFDYNFTEEK